MSIKDKTCLWEVKKGKTCDEPAKSEVLLRGQVGSGKIPVCENHKAEYNRRAARLRTRN